MRIFLAGATGVIGVRLVPLLVAAGHVVAGTTRSSGKVDAIASMGATPVVLDVFDAAAVERAIVGFAPELVMHQLTDLPDDPAELRKGTAGNARIRREGTANLIAGWRAAGATGLIAQSVAWELEGEGGVAKAELERQVLDVGGVVLRYGQFYGPGTYHSSPPDPPRVRIDEAARRTVDLLEAPSGIVTIIDR